MSAFQLTYFIGLVLCVTLWLWPLRARSDWWRGIDLLLATGLGALIIGRIGYAVIQLQANAIPLQDNLRFGAGGVNPYAALVGGLFGLIVIGRIRSLPLLPLLDRFAPLLLVVQATAWLACRFDRCAVGRESDFGWASADLPDQFGLYAIRYQTQLMGVGLTLLAGLLWWLVARRIQRPGIQFVLALSLMLAVNVTIAAWLQ